MEEIWFLREKGGCVMVQRYISAEQSIAAAGAAFACIDDDMSDIANARRAASQVWLFASLKDMMSRLFIYVGLKKA
jgi:hypothetical protein